MEHFLLRVVASALAVLGAGQLFASVEVASLEKALVFGVVLGVLNAFIRPILMIVTLPLNLMTLGLFTLVVNGIVFWIATLTPVGVQVHGVTGVIVGTLSVGIVSWLASRAASERGR